MGRRAACTFPSLGLLLGLNATWAMLSFMESSPYYFILNKHACFLFRSIILFHLFPEYCSLLSFTSWQKWDSCTINPLSDSTHRGWFCSKSFYKCWQQSFIFKHWEQRPWMCPTVANTVPKSILFFAYGARRPQLREYCRPIIALLA